MEKYYAEKSLTYEPEKFYWKLSQGTNIRNIDFQTVSVEEDSKSSNLDNSRERENSVNILTEVGDFQLFLTENIEIPQHYCHTQISPQKSEWNQAMSQ